ncbi:hypothetical protein BGS_1100 [Beggiatoa sp. SS]|nr:hypothetical protein BGS_1100 [Beggiatoa sp. SS]
MRITSAPLIKSMEYSWYFFETGVILGKFISDVVISAVLPHPLCVRVVGIDDNARHCWVFSVIPPHPFQK